METLFKHCNAEHAKMTRDRGIVRVGQLVAYRSMEDERRDDAEGRKSVTIRPEELIRMPSSELARVMPANVHIIGGFQEFHAGSKVDLGSELPPAYLFCVAERRPEGGKFGGSSYVITNSAMFGDCLNAALAAKLGMASQWLLEKVSYGSANQAHAETRDELGRICPGFLSNAAASDYFVKRATFAEDLEWRYVFFPGGEITEPFLDVACDVTEMHHCCDFSSLVE